MAGGAETPNIAALPALARLGACESARGPDADRRVKLLIQFAVEGSLSGAYSQRRVKHTCSFEERLAAEAERLREQAKTLPPGKEREELMRKVRLAETASQMNEWLKSPGLEQAK